MKGLLIASLFLAAWPWSSGKDYPMTASNSVPGATGMVRIEKDKENGNTKLDIKVDHLTNPSSLTPSANAYIVWVRPKDGSPVKQGAIRVDKDLKGELKVVTTSKDFDVFITAEQSESVSEPADLDLLRAHVSPN